MADPRDVNASAAKAPDAGTTGDEPMTGPQQSYLHTLAQQAGEEPPPDDLSKADASKAIDALQEKAGRGKWAVPVPSVRADRAAQWSTRSAHGGRRHRTTCSP